jgi:hypothetical protein
MSVQDSMDIAFFYASLSEEEAIVLLKLHPNDDE